MLAGWAGLPSRDRSSLIGERSRGPDTDRPSASHVLGWHDYWPRGSDEFNRIERGSN